MTPPPPPTWKPPGNKSRIPIWVFIVVTVVILCCIGALITSAVAFSNRDTAKPAPGSTPVNTGLTTTKEDAERDCYTAFRDEFQARDADSSQENVISSITNIQIQDSRPEAGGFSVNGTVYYSLTTANVAPIEGTLDLNCFALMTDSGMTTSVRNR